MVAQKQRGGDVATAAHLSHEALSTLKEDLLNMLPMRAEAHPLLHPNGGDLNVLAQNGPSPTPYLPIISGMTNALPDETLKRH